MWFCLMISVYDFMNANEYSDGIVSSKILTGGNV